MTVEFVSVSHEVLSGPFDVGTEQRWRIRLGDGRTAVVGQLAPDLARDVSIRRRYVRDVERIRDLGAISLAPTIAVGPEPDPRDPQACAPWRMRLDPDGQPLDTLLRRAPLPLEEMSELFAGLADAVHAVHATGAVIRDLRPEHVLRTREGRLLLIDVGLARVDVLSSHTASSLLFAGSKYAAPEQLHATIVDQRSDIFSLGVMMWEALTGTSPSMKAPARCSSPALSHPCSRCAPTSPMLWPLSSAIACVRIRRHGPPRSMKLPGCSGVGSLWCGAMRPPAVRAAVQRCDSASGSVWVVGSSRFVSFTRVPESRAIRST